VNYDFIRQTNKAFTGGRTDHFSNILADREFSAGCYLLTVSNFSSAFQPWSAVRAVVAELLLVAWSSGITSVFGRRAFAVLRSTCS